MRTHTHLFFLGNFLLLALVFSQSIPPLSLSQAQSWKNLIATQLVTTETELLVVDQYANAYSTQPFIPTAVIGKERVALLAARLQDALDSKTQLLQEASRQLVAAWNTLPPSPPTEFHVSNYSISSPQELETEAGYSQVLQDTVWNSTIAVAANSSGSVVSFFFASAKGVYRSSPPISAFPSDHDPRLQPWYAAAIVPRKRVIIITDLDSTAADLTTQIKQGVLAVLKSLSQYDYVGLLLV